MNRTLLFATLLGGALSSPATAQVASVLVREGDAPTGSPAGHTVAAITDPAVNHATGYAAGLSLSSGGSTVSGLWGTTTLGGAPAVFRTEGTINNFQQNSFESFWGYSDAGQACYSPLGDNLTTGGTSLDCVWLDNQVLAEEDQPIPSVPGTVWRFASRPGVSANGIPYWVSGLDDAVTGADLGYGLFRDTTATVVMKSGDVIPGTGGPIDTASGVDFDYRFSAKATHNIVPINTTEATTIDNYMTVDGSVLVAGGSPVQEGTPVPASIGGLAGENWDNFDYCGITESGQWFFTGDTEPNTADDEVIVKNGVVLYREGQALDGEVLFGSIDDAYMNEAGNIAYIWDVVDATAGDLEALFVNDKLILKEGDAVDLDGDGTIEPTSLLVNLTDVVIGDDSLVYFVASVDVNGTTTTTDDIEALFRVECQPVPYGIGKLNSAGKRSTVGWAGTPSLSAGNFSLEVGDLTAGNFGLAFYGFAPAQVPLFNHFRYVAAPITRILPAQKSSAAGTASVAIPIDASMVGTTRYYQYWQRDPSAPDGTGVELSSALVVNFCN